MTILQCICITYTTTFRQIKGKFKGDHTKQRMYITNNYTFLIKHVL